MKQKIFDAFWLLLVLGIGWGIFQMAINKNDLTKLEIAKSTLEIKVLQHELKAYEEMDKELAE